MGSNGKRRREPYFNDGRSPDKGSQLVPKTKKRRKSQKFRGAQRAPKLGDLVNQTHAIPFGFESGGVKYVNTCPLDSVLMCLYLMRKLSIVSVSLLQTDDVMHEVLNLIENREYTDARMTWIQHSTPSLMASGVFIVDPDGDGKTGDLFGDSKNFTASSPLFRYE